MDKNVYRAYNGEKYKYFCNDCDCIWFSDSYYEDLCPFFHCESEHIFSIEISAEDAAVYLEFKKEFEEIDSRKVELQKMMYSLPWIKDNKGRG